jgi:DNA repair protein RecO (recombination protein O)
MKYGNSSKIVSFYTRNFGKVSGIARGARRMKSRFGGGLEPFIESEFIFYYKSERSLQTITDSDICESFSSVRNDLYKSVYAYAACELIDGLTAEPSETIYDLFSSYLHMLGAPENKSVEILFWSFQLKLFTALGYQPEFDVCMACGEPLPPAATRFYLEQGGVVCPQCRLDEGADTISWGTIKLLQKLLPTPYAETRRYKIISMLQKEGRRFLDYYLAYHGGWKRTLISLQSLPYVERIRVKHA